MANKEGDNLTKAKNHGARLAHFRESAHKAHIKAEKEELAKKLESGVSWRLMQAVHRWQILLRI